MTRNEQRLLTMLRALRNTLAAAIDTIDLILDAADQDAHPTPDKKRGECPHPLPSRISKATMGNPHRFYCGACGQDVEG